MSNPIVRAGPLVGIDAESKEEIGVSGVSSHAWNADRSKVAIVPNDEWVEVWDTPGNDSSKWKPTHYLNEHAGFVSAVDWSSVSNQIVTCGHDRNAYVWILDAKTNEWKPTLVILRINRAATAVKWSPAGNKFAVASGSKCVPVCHFEASNNWWISKMIKKHKSTVTAIDWCPNNKFIVTGSTDYKARVLSAFVEGLDSAEDNGNYGQIWAQQHEFGECLAEFDAKAWVNSVAWSPSGFRIMFTGHGSTVHFVQIAATGTTVQNIDDEALPYTSGVFVDDDTVAVGGYTRNPAVYKHNGTEWKIVGKLDPEKAEEKKAGGATAMSKFKEADTRGQKFGGVTETDVMTAHKNTISSVQLYAKGVVSTAGLDGRILLWNI